MASTSAYNNELDNYNNLKIWSKNNVEFVDWCEDFNKIKSLNPNLPISNNHSSGTIDHGSIK